MFEESKYRRGDLDYREQWSVEEAFGMSPSPLLGILPASLVFPLQSVFSFRGIVHLAASGIMDSGCVGSHQDV